MAVPGGEGSARRRQVRAEHQQHRAIFDDYVQRQAGAPPIIQPMPPQWLDLLGLIRTVFFVVSFMLVSRMMWVYQEPQHEAKSLP